MEKPKRRNRIKPQTRLGLGIHTVGVSVLLIVGGLIITGLFLSLTDHIAITPRDWTIELVPLVFGISFGAVYLLVMAGLLNIRFGFSLIGLVIVSLAGAVIGGVIQVILGPGEGVGIGVGYGTFTSLAIAYLAFLIHAWRNNKLIQEGFTESTALVLSKNVDEGGSYALQTIYYVRVGFSTDRGPIHLNARVNRRVYRSTKIDSLISIRYLPNNPSVMLLEGEFEGACVSSSLEAQAGGEE